jgi:hypothetical protein
VIRLPLALIGVAVLAIAGAPAAGAGLQLDGAAAPSGVPFYYDALGSISDVTVHWQRYQPANVFCVRPEPGGYTPGGVGQTVTGRNDACRHSGYRKSATGLIVVRVRTPALCPGCRRLFIDFSKIPKADAPPYYYPRGHVFLRLSSANSSYTVDPIDHSPNTKNFTNDKLLAPAGSAQEQVIGAGDLHQMFGYVTDTLGFVHTALQGPYYVGPWYVSRQGRRVHGMYLDLDVTDATENPGGVDFNDVAYAAGFNSGQACPNDDDAFYGGCVDWWGYSTSNVNPYAPLG